MIYRTSDLIQEKDILPCVTARQRNIEAEHQLVLLDSRYARNVSRLDSTASTPVGRQRVGPEPRPEGVVVYWHVDDVPAAYDRLLSMGATPHEAPRDFGDGFIGATVIDPFGNILGLMYNPNYLEAAGADQD
jgi:hypothetical protein